MPLWLLALLGVGAYVAYSSPSSASSGGGSTLGPGYSGIQPGQQGWGQPWVANGKTMGARSPYLDLQGGPTLETGFNTYPAGNDIVETTWSDGTGNGALAEMVPGEGLVTLPTSSYPPGF